MALMKIYTKFYSFAFLFISSESWSIYCSVNPPYSNFFLAAEFFIKVRTGSMMNLIGLKRGFLTTGNNRPIYLRAMMGRAKGPNKPNNMMLSMSFSLNINYYNYYLHIFAFKI
jgi:hypothetical protein